MTKDDIIKIIGETDRYNLHSHTQFCDGHATMEEMARGASDAGMLHYGFSPHSPIPVDSPCNMGEHDVEKYIDEASHLKDLYADTMQVYTSMEIDYLSRDWGAHIDKFQRLPLDYRISSVHFVPSQDGVYIDCDGSTDRFKKYLKQYYRGDLRYVVEKFYEQTFSMIEQGGYEIICHFDKIGRQADAVMPGIESESWYESIINDVVSAIQSAGLIVEINTKAYSDSQRFYPEQRWWRKIAEAGLPVAVNSDAHWPHLVDAGRGEALKKWREITSNIKL